MIRLRPCEKLRAFFYYQLSPSCNLKRLTPPFAGQGYVAVAFFAVILVVLTCGPARAEVTEASYYTVGSCIKESGQFTMANGEELDDFDYTTASWEYKFGTMLKITAIDTGRSVIVRVTDRGPNRRLYQSGRKLDLSFAAMRALNGIEQGTIQVNIEEVI